MQRLMNPIFHEISFNPITPSYIKSQALFFSTIITIAEKTRMQPMTVFADRVSLRKIAPAKMLTSGSSMLTMEVVVELTLCAPAVNSE